MTPAEGVALLALALWGLLFARALRGFRDTLVPRPAPEVEAAVCALVPARDEAEVIEASVSAALSQPQLTRLVVVDDGSSDGTGEALARLAEAAPRLEVLTGAGPGPGECGKPAALVRAYEVARPEEAWLLFLDADVVLAEGALGALVAAAEAQGADLVSLVPTVALETLVERVVMPAVGALIIAHHPPGRVADPDDPTAFANGQVILLRRALYERVGGHRSVRREVLEDVALARRVKGAGGRLLIVDGRHLATTRMYASWGELAEGWIKNLYLLMDARLATALTWAAASIVFGSLGWVVAALAPTPIGASCGLGIVSMQAFLRWRGGTNPLYALFAPIGAAVAAGLLLVSARRHRAGGVTWKGRRYG